MFRGVAGSKDREQCWQGHRGWSVVYGELLLTFILRLSGLYGIGTVLGRSTLLTDVKYVVSIFQYRKVTGRKNFLNP